MKKSIMNLKYVNGRSKNVAGYLFNYRGHEWFVYKNMDENFWRTSHYGTSLEVGSGKTRKESIELTKDKIDIIENDEEFDEIIENKSKELHRMREKSKQRLIKL